MQITSQQPFCRMFLFINSSSGGGVGNALLMQEIDKIDFNLSFLKAPISVYFFNLRIQFHRERGFRILKKYAENGNKVIGVICGGDGTVMWVVNQLAKYYINPELVPLAIIPLGTGNDFALNLNWGSTQKTLIENSYESLKNLIRKWLSAQRKRLDIWEVSIQTYNNGYFEKIQNEKQVVFGQIMLIKNFCNYFSFGIDGKIGYQFDRHRTKSRIGNMAVYGAMGFKQTLNNAKNLGQLIEKIYLNGREIVIKQVEKSTIENTFNSIISFDMKKISNTIKPSNFKQNKNILCININSFMGGTKDLWLKGKENNQFRGQYTQYIPAYDDGILEFVSFESNLAMGFQKAFNSISPNGFSDRVFQSQGPVEFKFNSYPNTSHCTYAQIDGEYIKINHPASITIRKSNIIPNGQIVVLNNIE